MVVIKLNKCDIMVMSKPHADTKDHFLQIRILKQKCGFDASQAEKYGSDIRYNDSLDTFYPYRYDRNVV